MGEPRCALCSSSSWGTCNSSLHGLPGQYDFVVASDVLYDEETFEVLRETIERVAGPGATVVIAVHERPAAHAFFLAPSRFQWSLERCSEGPDDPVSGKTTIMIYVGREATPAARGGRPGALKYGDVVEVHSLNGLKGRDLNGLKGLLVPWNSALPQADGRWAVSFPPPLGRKAIRAACLRPVQ